MLDSAPVQDLAVGVDDARRVVVLGPVDARAVRVAPLIGETLMLASSLLQQWGGTRWSRDAAAGRSLIGARWRTAL